MHSHVEPDKTLFIVESQESQLLAAADVVQVLHEKWQAIFKY